MSQINVNIIEPLSSTTVTVSGVEIDSPTTSSVAIGNLALSSITTGTTNIGIGDNSLSNLSSGQLNIGIGVNAGSYIKTTLANTFIGHESGSAFDIGAGIGYYNTAVGYRSGYQSTGSQNIFLGYNAGGNNSINGNNNICIGANSETATLNSSNSITLGNSSHTIIRAAVTSITSLSDARDKSNVQDSTYGLNMINSLKPVSFEWDTRDGSKKGLKDLGFIAQDLQQVDDEYLNLVYDENPEKLEASYGKLIPVLVKAIQELTNELNILKQQLNK